MSHLFVTVVIATSWTQTSLTVGWDVPDECLVHAHRCERTHVWSLFISLNCEDFLLGQAIDRELNSRVRT